MKSYEKSFVKSICIVLNVDGIYLACGFSIWGLVLGCSGYALFLHSGSKLGGGCSCRLSCNHQLGIFRLI